MSDEIHLLHVSVERLKSTVDSLDEAAYRAPSRLPGWSRAHLVTHLARSSDSRLGMLAAARRDEVGRQYPSEESRAREISSGATRDVAEIGRDFHESLDRLLGAMVEHPPDRWDNPGEWLGVGRRPVRRAVPSMRREIEYHHVDLGLDYGPEDWPADFVAAQLDAVTQTMTGRPEAPAVTLVLADRTLRIGDGGLLAVAGDAPAVLAWLTGRGSGEHLRTDPPSAPLPELPPLA